MKIKQQIRHSLLPRLLASYLLFAFIPIVLVGWTLLQTAEDAIKLTISHSNMELAKKSATEIDNTISHAEDILKLTAQNPAVYRRDRITQELTINNLVQEFSLFRKVSFLDTNRNVVVTSAYAAYLTDVERDFLASTDQNKKNLSAVYISSDQLPCMMLAYPVRFRDEVVGRLVAEITLQAMWDLVDRDVIGEGGESFVIDGTRRYLAHSDRRLVYLNETFNEPQLLDRMMAIWNSTPTNKNTDFDEEKRTSENGIENPMADLTQNPPVAHNLLTELKEYRRSSDGARMIAAFVIIKDLNWALVIQQPADIALRPARRMRLQILYVILGILLAAAVLAYLYTRRIVNPVRRLLDGIEHFSTGDLKFRMQSEGQDEIGTLSSKFNEMADRLHEFQNKLRQAERMEIMGRMASMISHEIRNPLNSMVINLQVIKREISKSTPPDINKIEKYHTMVNSEIARIDNLVSDFLLISKPLTIKTELVDIRDILEDVVNSQKAESRQQNVKLSCPFRRSPVILNVDRDKIRQVFVNLFLNAVQSMPNGGLLRIELSCEDSMAAIEFKDTGEGIPPDKLEKIFDFYYSTKSGGTGLGLTIVRQIIEEHGGKVKVMSEVGRGTTFTVFLPSEFSSN